MKKRKKQKTNRAEVSDKCEIPKGHQRFLGSSVYLKDMVNQTAKSMKVVRLYSGLKQARILVRICTT